jgi:hypothetical protein
VKELGKEFIVIEPESLYSGRKTFETNNQKIAENEYENRGNARSHAGKGEKGDHQGYVGDAKAGHSHKGQSIGKIAAEDLKKLNNPFHEKIDDCHPQIGSFAGAVFEIVVRLLDE